MYGPFGQRGSVVFDLSGGPLVKDELEFGSIPESLTHQPVGSIEESLEAKSVGSVISIAPAARSSAFPNAATKSW